MALWAFGGRPVLVWGQSVQHERLRKPSIGFWGRGSSEISETMRGGDRAVGPCGRDEALWDGCSLSFAACKDFSTQLWHFAVGAPFFHWFLEYWPRGKCCSHTEQHRSFAAAALVLVMIQWTCSCCFTDRVAGNGCCFGRRFCDFVLRSALGRQGLIAFSHASI